MFRPLQAILRGKQYISVYYFYFIIFLDPGFDSLALQKKVVGLERGPLSLVSTTEELLDRKVAAPV
jgi:hypothetical protein